MRLNVGGVWHSRQMAKAVRRGAYPIIAALRSAFERAAVEQSSFDCLMITFEARPVRVIERVASDDGVFHVAVGYDAETPLKDVGRMVLQRTAEVLPSVIAMCPLENRDRHELMLAVTKWAETIGCGKYVEQATSCAPVRVKRATGSAADRAIEDLITVPTLLIPHDDFDFEFVGRYADSNQYMAFVTGAFPVDWISGTRPPDEFWTLWPTKKRWYAALHRFDCDGNHLGTDVRFGGTTADGEEYAIEQARGKLVELLGSLGPRTPQAIRVRPFGATVDGCFFGLVYEHFEMPDEDDRRGTYDHFMLEPNLIVFDPPWDSGNYST
ncbi:MAG TPA: hypothetical protein VND64_26935 [Pirellulales bacterium]|nr:hypothetical protein [Pirellulales bacterium]